MNNDNLTKLELEYYKLKQENKEKEKDLQKKILAEQGICFKNWNRFFIKEGKDMLNEILEFNGKQWLFFEMVDMLDKNNEIELTEKNLKHFLGKVKEKTLYQYFKIFVEKGLLRQVRPGVFMLNPKLVVNKFINDSELLELNTMFTNLLNQKILQIQTRIFKNKINQ